MKNILSAQQRRKALISSISDSPVPVSASALAAQFSVSRQVIVGDIALLRASGADISATPRGYVISRAQQGQLYTLACIHGFEDTAKELNIMVDNGCTVVDVIVEHPIYGQISGQLDITSRYDAAQFVEKLSTEDAPPLSSLTGGVHLHTLICPDEAAYLRVRSELAKEKLLLTE